jgi:hypothetical protein
MEYINKLTQFGRTEYDLIIDGNRVHTSFVEGEDTEEAMQERAAAILASINAENERANIRTSVVAKVEAGKNFMKSYVAAHPSITLEQFAAINGLVNQAMAPLGIALAQPNIQEILQLRIDESISHIQSSLETMEMNEDVATKVDTALATILGAMQ